MPQGSAEPRYKLIAIHQGDKIIIETVGEKLHFVKRACEVLFNSEILQGFSKKDIAIIGVVAGMMLGS